jgi:hypothetical protein
MQDIKDSDFVKQLIAKAPQLSEQMKYEQASLLDPKYPIFSCRVPFKTPCLAIPGGITAHEAALCEYADNLYFERPSAAFSPRIKAALFKRVAASYEEAVASGALFITITQGCCTHWNTCILTGYQRVLVQGMRKLGRGESIVKET